MDNTEELNLVKQIPESAKCIGITICWLLSGTDVTGSRILDQSRAGVASGFTRMSVDPDACLAGFE
jgi:hypothetical protein